MISLRFALTAVGLAVSSAVAVQAQPLAAGHSKFLGGIYSGSQAVDLPSYFNQVTPENAGKWGSVETTRDGAMNWTELDAAYALAKDNGFPFRFHVLVWGNQQPSWIAALPPAEQLEEIKEWFDAVAARYPAIDYLEVVNEPTNDPPDGAEDGGYINALGTSAGATPAARWNWVVNAFKLAREKFPATTKLVLNEYNVTNGGKLAAYLELIDVLKAENLVDVVGVQGHSFSTTINFTSSNTTIANLNAIAAKGLPIMVTEMDIDGGTDAQNDDARQLSEYQRIFPIFWEHPSVIGITLWGYRPGLWRNAQAAYLIRANGTERPAMTWLRTYLAVPVVAADQTLHVVKGWANDSSLGLVRASHGDVTKTLQGWTITGGTGANLFAINSTTGRVTVKDAAALSASATTSYTLDVTVTDGSAVSATETVAVEVYPADTARTRLMAIATRARAGQDAQTLIMGYVIGGAESKEMIVRGMGPSLAAAGVTNPLADPQLLLNQVVNGAFTAVDSNDDWGGSAEMSAAFARVGLTPPSSTTSKDAALVRSTVPGVYTAHVGSATATNGIALVEAYDGDTNSETRITALSTRTLAGGGEDTLIAGVVLGGTGPKTLMIRGLGPSLVSTGVPSASVLQDPRITVYSGSTAIATNEDWGGSAELRSVFTALGMSPLESATSKDAALLVTLEPGGYTIHVAGPSGTSGVALVEIYDVQ